MLRCPPIRIARKTPVAALQIRHSVENQFVKIADHSSNHFLRRPTAARLYERRHQLDPRIQTHNAWVARLANRFHQPVRESLHTASAYPRPILPFDSAVSRSGALIRLPCDLMPVLKQAVESSFDDASQKPPPCESKRQGILDPVFQIAGEGSVGFEQVRVLPSRKRPPDLDVPELPVLDVRAVLRNPSDREGKRPIASSTTPPSRMPPDWRTIRTASPGGVSRSKAPAASCQAKTRSTGAAMRVRRTNCRVFMRTSSLTRPAGGLTRPAGGLTRRVAG